MLDNKINDKPIVRFGIIADVQYANTDDLLRYGRMRYYRNSLNLLRNAIKDWKESEKTESKIEFILEVGDLADSNFVPNRDELLRNYSLVLKEFENLFSHDEFKADNYFDHVSNKKPKLLHVWGNHESYGITRRPLSNSCFATSRILNQNKGKDLTNYYWYDISDRLRLIVLDLYEISPLGYEKNDEIYKIASKIIEDNDKLLKSTDNQEEKDYLLRFKIYGGAASEKQLKWLDDNLKLCKETNKRVIMASHVPLLKEAADSYVAWNADDILKIMWSYENTVLAYLSGHYHVGGYFLDSHNIHHLTLTGILETAQNANSYATGEVYDDKLVIKNQSPIGSFTAYF